MTTTQQQILDELLRLLSCPDRWSYQPCGRGGRIYTREVFIFVVGGDGNQCLEIYVNEHEWKVPSECWNTLREAACSVSKKLSGGSTSSNEDLILESLKTTA